MSKIITAAVWSVISIAFFIVAVLVVYQFGNSISYWLRVIWIEVIISLMIASSYLFMNSALHGKISTVGNAVFASKCYGIGFISIYFCIRSYFFTSSIMQISHIIIQILLITGLSLIFIGVKSIDLISKNQKNEENLRIVKLNVYLSRINNLKLAAVDEILIAKLNKIHDYFATNIKTLNGDKQIVNLQKIDLILTSIESSPEHSVQLINQVNELEVLVRKFYVI